MTIFTIDLIFSACREKDFFVGPGWPVGRTVGRVGAPKTLWALSDTRRDEETTSSCIALGWRFQKGWVLQVNLDVTIHLLDPSEQMEVYIYGWIQT